MRYTIKRVQPNDPDWPWLIAYSVARTKDSIVVAWFANRVLAESFAQELERKHQD